MGGRGSSFKKYDNISISANKRKRSKELLPATMNRISATGTVEKMTNHFYKTHGTKNHEFALIMDKDGYVEHYLEGQRHSVSLNGNNIQGKNITHNHPGNDNAWANLSKPDLSLLWKGANSVSAVSRNKRGNLRRVAGIYTVSRTHKFKRDEFKKAVRNLNVKTLPGDGYDRKMDNWLEANQSKYGYKYTFKRATNPTDGYKDSDYLPFA